MPPSNFGGIFLISVIISMHNLDVNGVKVRVTKYKVIIYEGKNSQISEETAANIALYLKNEGFIKKEEIAVEIVPLES